MALALPIFSLGNEKMGEEDEVLLVGFTKAVQDMLITQHVSTGSYPIKLSLRGHGDEARLEWRGGRPVGPNPPSMPRILFVRDISEIQLGNAAPGFGNVEGGEDVCLSLMTKVGTRLIAHSSVL